MQPPDLCLVRPWFEPVVLGVRRAYAWAPAYLAGMRTSYAQAYWNPTPGAAVMVDGTRLLLDRRALVLIPAGAWFQRENLAPFDHWWSHLRLRARPSIPGAQQVAVAGELEALLDGLWRRCWSEGVATPAAQAEAHAVLALALARIAWAGDERGGAHPHLGELVRDLEEEGYPHLANDRLAARLGMHPKAFCRLFRQEVGVPPQDWLRARRLDRAAGQLDLGMPVEEVAAAGGFTDRFHFGRLFRQHHGVGPGYYRRLAVARGVVAAEPAAGAGRSRRKG
jgi:AraC-like DNA-binding protein